MCFQVRLSNAENIKYFVNGILKPVEKIAGK